MLTEVINHLNGLFPVDIEGNNSLYNMEVFYGELLEAHHNSRSQVLSRPMQYQDGTIDANGELLRALALKTAEATTRAANYNPYGSGPHYLEIGNGFWFHIGESRLVERRWKVNKLRIARPDFHNAPDATARDWYTYGIQVADRLITGFVGVHQLPSTFKSLVSSPV